MNYLTTIFFSGLLCACSGEMSDPPNDPPPTMLPPPACDPELEPARPDSLQWKRSAAFVADLAAALDLAPDALCTELGAYSCESLHLVALGGNDAEGAANYFPVESPLATTSAAIDRIVLSACENAANGTTVFTDLPPSAAPVTPSDPAIDAQIRSLYRRLLRRDATDGEVAIARELATDGASPRTARELDVLACFAIGSTSENVLF